MMRLMLPDGVCTSPQALRPGDTVRVVAPAGPVTAPRLQRGLAVLAQRYRVQCGPGVWRRDGYLAGSDEERAEALAAALSDPDVRAIFCARGGFGVTRILAQLDPAALQADPRPIVGFSDITALHAWASLCGVASIHGPVVTQLGELPADDVQHLFTLLEDPRAEGILRGRPLRGDGAPVTGVLRGGNLSLLGALAGTPWQLRLEGALLLVEDVAEASYRLDRTVTQLRQQPGPLGAERVAGVGLGSLHRCRDEPGRPSALTVVAGRLAPQRPVVAGLPFGHGDRNRAWPVGVAATLDPERGEIRWRGAVG